VSLSLSPELNETLSLSDPYRRCSTSETFLSQISSAETDLFGLNSIYHNLGGDFWYNNEDWITPFVSHCDWYGVECKDGRVTSLKLNDNNLTGDFSFFGKGENFGEDSGALFNLEELYVQTLEPFIFPILTRKVFLIITSCDTFTGIFPGTISSVFYQVNHFFVIDP
jgi:hypothetical protein